MQKFMQNKNFSNLEPKMSYVGIFWVVILNKTFIVIENSIFKFVKTQRLTQKQKSWNLEQKMPYLSVF